MIQGDYFEHLTPRQKLNDLVHKYAQRAEIPYNQAWKELERRYSLQYGENLSILRWKQGLRIGRKLTIPAYLDINGKLSKALEIGFQMVNEVGK